MQKLKLNIYRAPGKEKNFIKSFGSREKMMNCFWLSKGFQNFQPSTIKFVQLQTFRPSELLLVSRFSRFFIISLKHFLEPRASFTSSINKFTHQHYRTCANEAKKWKNCLLKRDSRCVIECVCSEVTLIIVYMEPLTCFISSPQCFGKHRVKKFI